MLSKIKNTSFGRFLCREAREGTLLLRSIPTSVVTLFVVSVICMNLLANKTLYQSEWLALDGGILVSWLSFMCMDLITKYFGPRASNRIALLACGINLLTCAIFYLAGSIPSNASDYTALDGVLRGSWFILFGSTVAFLSSAIINNLLNFAIGRAFRRNPEGKLAFAVSCYVSTFIGQFLDNFIFSMIVFVGFAPIFWDGFCWTPLQCATCALTGAVAELVMEMLFSPVGYKIFKRWHRLKVGREYLDMLKEREENQ